MRFQRGVSLFLAFLILGCSGKKSTEPDKTDPQSEQLAGDLSNIHFQKIHAQGEDIIYAGAFEGLYRSTDGGQHWDRLQYDGLVDISDLLQLAAWDSMLFVATNGSGVMAFDKSGQRVPLANSGLGDPKVFDLSGPNGSDASILAGTDPGIYVTKDMGDSWEYMQGAGHPWGIHAISTPASQPGILAVGTFNSGIFISRNGGSDWLPRNVGLPRNPNSTYAKVVDVQFHPNRSQTLFAILEKVGLFKSEDLGETWDMSKNTSPGASFNCILISSDAAHRVYLGGTDGLWISEDDGKSWQAFDGLPRDTNVKAMDMVNLQDAPVLYLATWSSGIFKIFPERQSATYP